MTDFGTSQEPICKFLLVSNTNLHPIHRRRSGWNYGETHGKDRGGSVRSGVGYGMSPPQPTKGSGERRELPQWGLGRSPGRKWILAYFEGHRTLLLYLYDKIWGGQFTLASSTPVPRDLRPWSYLSQFPSYCTLLVKLRFRQGYLSLTHSFRAKP